MFIKEKMYKIITASSIEELADKVDLEVRRAVGWKPHGGAFTTQDIGTVYCQPMLLKKPGKPRTVSVQEAAEKQKEYNRDKKAKSLAAKKMAEERAKKGLK